MDAQYDDYDDVQFFEPEEEDWGSIRDLDLAGIDAADAWIQCTEAEIVSRKTLAGAKEKAMSHKYVLVRIYSNNPCAAFPLGNWHDGPEIFADLQTAERVKFYLGVQHDDELGQYYLPAKIIDATEAESMEELGHPIASLPDDTPVAVII